MNMRSPEDQAFHEEEGQLRIRHSDQEKMEAVDRELSYRRRVYPRLIESRKMTPDLAARQISLFESIAADYRAAVRARRLL